MYINLCMLCHKIADCSILYTYDKITLSTRLIYSSVLHTTFKPKLQSKRGKHYIFKETAMLLWKWRDFKRAQHHDSVVCTLVSRINQRLTYLAEVEECNPSATVSEHSLGNRSFGNFIAQNIIQPRLIQTNLKMSNCLIY